jgi:transcriptional regulator of acetoin/glycerol metabolism
VLQNQRPILVSKEGTIARNLSNEAADNQLDDELTVEPGPSMIVPLSYQGRKLGVVIARNRPYENDFHQRHLDLFTALASQASSAIETARLMIETNGLLAQTQQQARQLQYVIDAIPVGVLLLDGEQRVVQANATGKFHLQMLSGLQVGDILHELDRQPVQSLLMRHAQSEPAEIIVGGHKFEITVQKIHRRRWILITHQITGDPTMPQLNALAGADREPLFSLRLPLGLLFDS